MKQRLVEKLKLEAEKDIKKESEIAYILVLIRKILDTDLILKDKYIILYFYCNWSLHIKMDRTPKPEIKKIIKSFLDDKVKSGFFDLNDFRKEFIKFLEEINIDHKYIYKDTNSILAFTNLVRNLLIDSPLEFDGNKITITNSTFKNKMTLVGFNVEKFK